MLETSMLGLLCTECDYDNCLRNFCSAVYFSTVIDMDLETLCYPRAFPKGTRDSRRNVREY